MHESLGEWEGGFRESVRHHLRIAATADGDDLLFTAGNRLWRLEDAFV